MHSFSPFSSLQTIQWVCRNQWWAQLTESSSLLPGNPITKKLSLLTLNYELSKKFRKANATASRARIAACLLMLVSLGWYIHDALSVQEVSVPLIPWLNDKVVFQAGTQILRLLALTLLSLRNLCLTHSWYRLLNRPNNLSGTKISFSFHNDKR